LSHGCLKAKVKNQGNKTNKTIQGMLFRAFLGWSLKHVAQNYFFILISFHLYIEILGAKTTRVNKD